MQDKQEEYSREARERGEQYRKETEVLRVELVSLKESISSMKNLIRTE